MEKHSDVTRVNPATGIGDRGFNKAIGGRLEADGDAAAWRRKLDSIANEIPEDLFQFIAVALDRWKPFCVQDLECNCFITRNGAQIFGDYDGRMFRRRRV